MTSNPQETPASNATEDTAAVAAEDTVLSDPEAAQIAQGTAAGAMADQPDESSEAGGAAPAVGP